MNATFKIQQLWQYLGIQDDEILIVRTYNPSTNKDEYLIAESAIDGLKIVTATEVPKLQANKPFQMVQQRDSSGKFAIPSVTQLINDKVSDY